MTGTTASTLTARSAHREWATRPPDERFASVHALQEAARARRLGTMERRIDTGALGTLAVTDDELRARPRHRHRAPHALELPAARHHRRRAVATARATPWTTPDAWRRTGAEVTGYSDNTVVPADLVVPDSNADSATHGQWTVMGRCTAVPNAKVILGAYRLSYRKEPSVPALIGRGVLVTRRVGLNRPGNFGDRVS